ncbi:MAG: DUF4942 domain-containing protein [Elusimicrobiaceae bacterium]|nr:DUF4942 domain-containing protein [Elusimicrobiaceae bacterium]
MSQNIFDTEYFPTPDDVIRKMVSPYTKGIDRLQILEPSAGTGSILDYLTESYSCKVPKKNLYAVEINPELVYVLQGKGYKILTDDFLGYKPVHTFDLIVMNPPFSNGDEHLLHAWDIMWTGDVVCLLNAETIRNPYTQKRQLLAQIIKDHGSVEYLGRCFKGASRQTNVDVAMVRLHKEVRDARWDIDFGDDAKMDAKPDFSEAVKAGSELAIMDKLGSYLHAWEKAQEAAVEFIKARKKLDFFVTAFMGTEEVDKLVGDQLREMRGSNNDMQVAYNCFLNTAKSKAWREIIQNMGMDKYMTANLRKTFDQFCESQGAYELNRENIYKLIQFVCLNSQNILKKAVVDVYDMFTKFHKANTEHTEGWKTNSQFKVNKKVILPCFVSADWSYNFRADWNYSDEYRDIDKVMCFISGVPYESLNSLSEQGKAKVARMGKYAFEREATADDYEHLSLRQAISFVRKGDSSLHDSEFFKFRCYLKGTLHIYFKSDDLWARFNLAVNEGKKELGFTK